MIIISCDPGKTGGVVILNDGVLIETIPIPLTKDKSIDIKKLHWEIEDVLVDYWNRGTGKHEQHCCIEFVHAMPAQGVSSSFAFGKTTGMLEAVLATYHGEDSVAQIRPQAWKKHFGLLKTTKEDAVALAEEMDPEIWDSFKKKPNKQVQSGIADAYLIGKYYEFMLSQQETD